MSVGSVIREWRRNVRALRFDDASARRIRDVAARFSVDLKTARDTDSTIPEAAVLRSDDLIV
jgi:predicted alpha/beta hydrolase